MKRFLLPLVALSIALTSCSRDNDDVINNPITNPVEQGNLLAEISGVENGTLNSYFTYNGDKIQSSSIVDGNTSYTYDGDKITNSYRERYQLGIFNTRYIYNPNGTLKTTLETHTNKIYAPNFTTQTATLTNYKWETTREYTYIGNIVKVKVTTIESNDKTSDTETTIRNHTFTLDNGNIIKKEIQTTDWIINTTTYTYDNKINPLSKVKGLAALNIEFQLTSGFLLQDVGLFDMNINRNNITFAKTTTNAYHNQPDVSQESNVYEYNSKGYPTKRTNTYTNIEANTNTSTYIYKYK